jgi:hypothetical protein
MNAPITDPWYSRPIDVHRWSEHPEASRLKDRLWEAHFQDFDRPDRSGPKPMTSFKQQFGVLLLDLFVAWKTDPELSIGVPMSSNGWNTNSRYNALKLSRKIIPLVGRAHEAGLIDLARGSYSGPYGRGNRNTRIRAAGPLRDLFASVSFDFPDVRRHPEQECIILKGGDDLLEYEDDDNTRAMRESLRAYNDLLTRTFIDIPALEQPFIDREITTGPDAGRVERIAITDEHKFVRRIFSRGRWNLNGRFYGPWWQQVGKSWRSQIFINDSPTVEIDFKGLHINLLSLEQGVVIEGDPYEFPEGTIPGTSPSEQRQLLKSLVLKAINAPSKPSAFSSFRQDWPTGHMAKSLTNSQLSSLIELFLEKHPQLYGKLCSDHGIRLMFVDSCLADQIHTVATTFNLPVLSVHDSFIVAREDQETLTHIMRVATKQQLGHELKTDVTALDDLPARSDGYLSRLARHQTDHPLTVPIMRDGRM